MRGDAPGVLPRAAGIARMKKMARRSIGMHRPRTNLPGVPALSLRCFGAVQRAGMLRGGTPLARARRATTRRFPAGLEKRASHQQVSACPRAGGIATLRAVVSSASLVLRRVKELIAESTARGRAAAVEQSPPKCPCPACRPDESLLCFSACADQPRLPLPKRRWLRRTSRVRRHPSRAARSP